MSVLVDAMNVVGHRPDGWWRDRDGAVRRLAGGLALLAAEGEGPFVLVPDAGGPGLAAACRAPGVEMRMPAGRGRGAADDEIVRIVAARADPGGLTVVTADRGLAARVRALGAGVAAPGALLARIDAARNSSSGA